LHDSAHETQAALIKVRTRIVTQAQPLIAVLNVSGIRDDEMTRLDEGEGPAVEQLPKPLV
jgi:hypothetical protein